MTDKEPTQEQIKEFWERCGFIEHLGKELWRYERYKETNYWWEAPNGAKYVDLPILDLNNLFKHAVPELQRGNEISIMLPPGLGKRAIVRIGHNEAVDSPSLELALFWAIWAVSRK